MIGNRFVHVQMRTPFKSCGQINTLRPVIQICLHAKLPFSGIMPPKAGARKWCFISRLGCVKKVLVGMHLGVAVSQEKLKLPQIELASHILWRRFVKSATDDVHGPCGYTMTKPPFPLIAKDLAQFTRALARQLGENAPSHLRLMNMLARAAGFQNLQHLRGAQSGAAGPAQGARIPDVKAVERAMAQFDDLGRLRQWPAKRATQTLALWAIWAVLPAKAQLDEREISALLTHEHCFGDAATLRRTMISCQMLTRQVGGVDYLRVEQEPPPEARALIRAVTARRKLRKQAT
jgi:hypothetical protein